MTENTVPVSDFELKKPNKYSNLIKRLFDVAFSAAGLALLSPLFGLIAWRIRRDSPGPVFYRGERLGRGGRTFRMLKFRTMREEPQSYTGPPITSQDDPRITRIGRWLRNTKLNELPQLWNVLMGEMSLVGPRPEHPQIALSWPEAARAEVLSVRPGITSPASVFFRNEESLLNGAALMPTYLEVILPSKLRLDQLYVRNRSFWADLDALFLTFMLLFPRLRTYELPEEMLFFGPVYRVMRRYARWFVVDLATSFLAMGLVSLAWRSIGPLNVGIPAMLLITLGFALLFSLSGALMGNNRIYWSKAPAEDAYRLVIPVLLATSLALGFDYLWPWGRIVTGQPHLPPGLILMAAGVALLGFLVVRYRIRLLSGFAIRVLARRGGVKQVQERVLIVGAGEAGQFTAWLLHNNHNGRVFRVVGCVDDDLFNQKARIHGLDVLGRREDIPRLVKELDIGLIIFAIHNITASERRRVLEICQSSGARLVLMPDIPGAMNAIALNKQPAHPAVAHPESRLPCELCLTRVSPLRVDGWLAELQGAAQAGDLHALQGKLQELRVLLQPDVYAQVAANEGEGERGRRGDEGRGREGE